MNLTCRLCDVHINFPYRPELAAWTTRAFLFVHEHRDDGFTINEHDLNEALREAAVACAIAEAGAAQLAFERESSVRV